MPAADIVNVPKPKSLPVAAVTGMKALSVLSTSTAVNVPVTGPVPGVALFWPPASVTSPVIVPPISAASFAPLMVIFTDFVVPSSDVTVKLSIRVVPTFRASTVGFASLSV